MSEEILFEVKPSGIAWLTFNRPEARNAMTFGMYEKIGEICQRIDTDGSVRVLILRGAGDKAFVSGTDISQFRDFRTAEQALAYEKRMDAVFDALEDVRVPTIASIQGACTGGGAGIAAACDLRVGAPSAKFGFPIARTLGNTLSMRNHARLAALLGVARTKEMIYLARLLDAQEMLRSGSSPRSPPRRVFRPGRGDGAGASRARALTLRGTKEALSAIVRHWNPGGGDSLVVRSYTSSDFQEGVESFLAKRKPRWRGE
jgi:enoyl-CoA hydratase/carnithine racemase